MERSQLSAIALASILVLSVFAAVPVTAQEQSVTVTTAEPTGVTTEEATLNGNLTTLENASDATIWFEYWPDGDPANASESPNLTASSEGPFAIDVDDLTSDTTYVVIAHAETENASAVGNEVTFTTDAVETVAVETDDATDVTASTATLTGELTELRGAENASVWFEYWVADDRTNNSTTTAITLDQPSVFSAAVDGLAADTDYRFVAHAATANISATGEPVEFTTEEEDTLTVVTEAPTDVTNRSTTLNGELTDLGNASNATVWFEYWERSDRDNASNTSTQTLDEPGAFSAAVDDLEDETTYHVVAHARAGNQSAAGDAVTFTTEPDEPPLDVETSDASDVANTSATLNGELTGLGGEADIWFEYWEQGDRANNSTTPTGTLSAPGAFSAAVDGLDNETTYVYVAHAEANDTLVTGDEVTFTTGSPAAGEPSWDGEGPFGRWLSSVIKNLVPPGGDVPFGQIVSDIVTANNPGSEHRSDNANPGGNGQGPPEHAGPPDDDDEDEDDRGPPAHAKGGDDDEDEFTVTVDGDLEPGATITVTVTHDGAGVENATVSVNDETVGTTGGDGQLAVTLPDDLDDEVEIEVETEDGEGEWEHEFEDDDDDDDEEADDD